MNCFLFLGLLAGCGMAAAQATLPQADATFTFDGHSNALQGGVSAVEHLVNDAGYTPFSARDERNQVLYLNGASWLEAPELAHLDLSGGLTIALRFKSDGERGGVLISQRGILTRRVFQISLEGEGEAKALQWLLTPIGKGDYTLKTPEIDVKEWKTAVLIYDPAGAVSIYINGERIAHDDQGPGRLSEVRELPWLFGAQPYPSTESPSAFLTGYLDAVTIWARPLSPEEVPSVTQQQEERLPE